MTGVAQTRIRVTQLSRNVGRAHVEEIFGTYGTVKSIELPMEKLHPELIQGHAVVEFADPAEAAEAVKRMDGGQIDGQEVLAVLLPAAASGPPARSDRDRGRDRDRDRSPLRSRGGDAATAGRRRRRSSSS